jgi:hypothetical protein
MADQPIKINVEYSSSSDLDTYLVTGAYGGIIPTGQAFNLNFYVERPKVPKGAEIELRPDGAVTTEKQIPAISIQERKVVFSGVMDYGTLKIISAWMNGKIAEWEHIIPDLKNRKP